MFPQNYFLTKTKWIQFIALKWRDLITSQYSKILVHFNAVAPPGGLVLYVMLVTLVDLHWNSTFYSQRSWDVENYSIKIISNKMLSRASVFQGKWLWTFYAMPFKLHCIAQSGWHRGWCLNVWFKHIIAGSSLCNHLWLWVKKISILTFTLVRHQAAFDDDWKVTMILCKYMNWWCFFLSSYQFKQFASRSLSWFEQQAQHRPPHRQWPIHPMFQLKSDTIAEFVKSKQLQSVLDSSQKNGILSSMAHWHAFLSALLL